MNAAQVTTSREVLRRLRAGQELASLDYSGATFPDGARVRGRLLHQLEVAGDLVRPDGTNVGAPWRLAGAESAGMTDAQREQSKRGGVRANAGRKPSDDPKKTFPVRLTGEQRLKLEALGGVAWIRAQIDAAPWPKG